MSFVERSQSKGLSDHERAKINAILLERVDGPFEPFPENWVEDSMERAKQRAIARNAANA